MTFTVICWTVGVLSSWRTTSYHRILTSVQTLFYAHPIVHQITKLTRPWRRYRHWSLELECINRLAQLYAVTHLIVHQITKLTRPWRRYRHWLLECTNRLLAQLHAVTTLCDLSTDSSSRDGVISGGGVKPLLSFVHLDDKELKMEVLSTLCNITWCFYGDQGWHAFTKGRHDEAVILPLRFRLNPLNIREHGHWEHSDPSWSVGSCAW